MHTWYEQGCLLPYLSPWTFGAEKTNTLTETAHRLTELESLDPAYQRLKWLRDLHRTRSFESCTHGYDTKDFRSPWTADLVPTKILPVCAPLPAKTESKSLWWTASSTIPDVSFSLSRISAKAGSFPYKDWYRGVNFGWEALWVTHSATEAWQGHFELPCLNLWNPEIRQYPVRLDPVLGRQLQYRRGSAWTARTSWISGS